MKRSEWRMAVGSLLLAPLSAFACASASSDRSSVGVADASAAIREDRDEIPCAPRAVLENVCQKCHALRPRGGAPFPLVRRSDIVSSEYQGTVVRELMVRQVESGRMPLSPVSMDPEARDALLGWLREGAPAVTRRSCADARVSPQANEDAALAAGPSPPSTEGGANLDAGSDADAAPADASSDGEPEAAPP